MTTTKGQILVTGANGLIGRALRIQLTAGGHRVVSIVRPGDRTDPISDNDTVATMDLAAPFELESVVQGPIRCIIHLAQARDYRSFPVGAGDVAAIAVTSTCRLAEAAVRLGVDRFVLGSSGGVCGSSVTPLDENSAIRPVQELGFYLHAKAFAERALDMFRDHLDVLVLRYFFVYGPNQRQEMLIPRLLNLVKQGEPIELAGNVGPTINPVHVDDAAAATALAIDCAPTPLIHVAGSETTTIRQLAEMIGAAVGRPPVFTKMPGSAPSYLTDINRMRQFLTNPSTTLTDGLALLAGNAPTSR